MIINLSHYKGGVGKTTLAVNLAITLKADILDLDGQQSSVMFNNLRKSRGHKSLNIITTADGNKMKEIFKKYQDDKILVIDSGGYDSDINRLAMLSSDMLITPVSPSQVEIFGLQKYELILQEISEKYGSNFKTNVVINNADIRSKSAILELKRFIVRHHKNFDMFDTVINARTDYKRAYGDGVSVVEMDKESKATDEIERLIKEIRKEIENG